MVVGKLTAWLTRLFIAVVERNTGFGAEELMPERLNSQVFCHNVDSLACYERRVFTIAVFINNDTDRGFKLGEVAIVRHKAVSVTSMAHITGQ